jgi:hypothetical protein
MKKVEQISQGIIVNDFDEKKNIKYKDIYVFNF